MKRQRLTYLILSLVLGGGTAWAQSLPAVVKEAATAKLSTVHAKRVITNDDIPPAVEPATPTSPKLAKATMSLSDSSADDEICQYIGDLRAEEKQLQQRVKKLQSSLEKADSEMLRTVYTHALVRLTDSLTSKQVAREEAESTPQGSGCSPKSAQVSQRTEEQK